MSEQDKCIRHAALTHALAKIDHLKALLDQQRPLSPHVVASLHENLVLHWIFHSNAIEGNTLTLKETKVVLEGITIGGKTLREHFEVINHREAIALVEEWVTRREPLSETAIKVLHQLLLKNIDVDNAGRYREVNVLIAGAQHRPPTAWQVANEMQAFMHWYQTEAADLHPIERAVRVHGEFVKIHPFIDGNGRTSRLLMNLVLLQAGLPAMVIEVSHRLAYYEALDKAHCEGDYTDFIQSIANACEQSFEPYWWALGMETQAKTYLEELGYGA